MVRKGTIIPAFTKPFEQTFETGKIMNKYINPLKYGPIYIYL